MPKRVFGVQLLRSGGVAASSAALGRPCDAHALLAPVLSNDRIFGVDLYESGLGAQVETYFTQLIRGPHAVRDTLHAFVQTVC